MTTRQLASPTRAHPRSRGENPFCAVMRISWLGSSPLTRGKRFTGCESLGSFGLIPAHAGKTSTRPCRRSRASAHPHSRGEYEWPVVSPVIWRGSSPLTQGNTNIGHTSADNPGSSPLTRGKHGRLPRAARTRGLIPAHAGKTATRPPPPSSPTAHPRSHGENTMRTNLCPNPSGSSPLTQGKPVDLLLRRALQGLIPAHAGKTSRRAGSP